MGNENFSADDLSIMADKMKAVLDAFINPFAEMFVAQLRQTMRELGLLLEADKRRRKLRRRNFYKSGKHAGFKRRWRSGRP